MRRYRLGFAALGVALFLGFPAVHAAGDPAAGEAIYNKSCKMCHATGVMDAPKVGDQAAWQARIAKGEEALLENVKQGLGRMMPKGGCSGCSDAELRKAIAYMVGRSR